MAVKYVPHIDTEYHDLGNMILNHGVETPARNGHTTKNIYGATITIDIETDGFPIISMRKVFFDGILGEFLSFCRHSMYVDEYKRNGCNYWDKFADHEDYIDANYSTAWYTQLSVIENMIKDNPESRQIYMNLWDPDRRIATCHTAYHFIVAENKLHLHWFQRSCDFAVGLPSDLVLAGLLLCRMSASTGYEPGCIWMALSHVHIYDNHIDKMKELLKFNPVPYTIPELTVNNKSTILSSKKSDFELKNYNPDSAVKFELNL